MPMKQRPLLRGGIVAVDLIAAPTGNKVSSVVRTFDEFDAFVEPMSNLKEEKWAEKLFVMNQKRDSIKVEFLKENKIPLLVIPYWDFERIDSLICDVLKTLSV